MKDFLLAAAVLPSHSIISTAKYSPVDDVFTGITHEWIFTQVHLAYRLHKDVPPTYINAHIQIQ